MKREPGAAPVLTMQNGTWSRESFIKASNAAANALFGTSIAARGDAFIAGAPQEASASTGLNGNQNDSNASGSGAVYAFRKATAAGFQSAYIKSPVRSGQFGTSLAFIGEGIAVGAPSEPAIASTSQSDSGYLEAGAGAVYIVE